MAAYAPIFELTRGNIIESMHHGAAAVVDAQGNLVAWVGDAHAVTFLRSTAKPFQALPFIESGGHEAYGLTAEEIAILCASHTGTNLHVEVLRSVQTKTGVQEGDLLCGVHAPYDAPTAEALKARGEEPTTNRHNCSGKHTGMLACCRLKGWPMANYIDPAHPLQQAILRGFAEMCGMAAEDVAIGIDGCSAPNFAVPLYNAAWAWARLADPSDLADGRAAACRTIVSAMMGAPEMVSGPGHFDTVLMQAMPGRVLAKGGAEGYQGMALMPGALGAGSPALGIAIKIADGDLRSRAGDRVAAEILRQLGALSDEEANALDKFAPTGPVYNWRKLEVGEMRPSFRLERNETTDKHG